MFWRFAAPVAVWIVRLRAANIDIEKTDVSASTIHNTFDFDGEYKSRLDFSKLTSAKVADLMVLEVGEWGGRERRERRETRRAETETGEG